MTGGPRTPPASGMAGATARRPRIEFLDRASYRQRRFRDLARMMPVFAAVLMAFPVMWQRDAPDQSLTSSGFLYLFGLWAVLVAVAAVLARVLRVSDGGDDAAPEGRSGGDDPR